VGHDTNQELSTKFTLENPEGNDRLGDPGIDELTILTLQGIVVTVCVTVKVRYPLLPLVTNKNWKP
jgi:hypothetical protein